MKYSLLNRLYINKEILEEQNLIFYKDQYHYLKSVLRLKISNKFRVFNEISGEFLVEIIEVYKDHLICKVIDKLRKVQVEKDLTLAICLIKPDRLIEAIKGAVQLGVTKIIPTISKRTQIKQFNNDRLSRCVIEATEQCERIIVPSITKIMRLEEFLNDINSNQIIFANEDERARTINSIKDFNNQIAVLIGPEGGFTLEEQYTLKNCPQVISISLNKNVLRSEVATIAAISCITMIRG